MAAQRLATTGSVSGPTMPASVYEMTVIGVLIVIALYIGQVVLVPLALAVILAFVLAPPVRMLRRTGIGNTASVFVVVGIAFAIIFGVDELMDMGRTAVNLIGNCLATAVIARWEGEFDDERARIFGTVEEVELDLREGDVAAAESARR